MVPVLGDVRPGLLRGMRDPAPSEVPYRGMVRMDPLLGRLTRSSRSRAAAAALRSRKHDSVARECYSGRFIEEHLEDDRANPDRGPSGFRIDTPDD